MRRLPDSSRPSSTHTVGPVIKGAESLAYPSRLVSHERLEISSRTAADRGPGNAIEWASIDADLELVRRTKANLLVIGSECVVTGVVRRVIADVPASVVQPEAGRLLLSEAWPHPGTVLVHD